jgi:hypothetical protein
MRAEGDTIPAIRRAIRHRKLQQPFRAADVNVVLGIDYAGTFLSKHCDERSDKTFTWLFDRVGRGQYRLNDRQQAAMESGY